MIDRISSLPDHILSLILSFLPTKYSVATSTLSHRWTDIWTTTPVLHLDYENHSDQDIQKFICFLENVLSRLSSPSFQKFRFYYTHSSSMDKCLPRIIDFVQSAVSREVVEVDIQFLYCTDVIGEIDLGHLPRNSFEVLRIHANVYVHIPTSVCFGNLKKFHIILKHDVNNELTSKLFSSLPQLEELKLEVHGGFQEIQQLYVLVDAPALEYITLKDEVLASYTFKSLSATVQAKIGVGYIFESYEDEIGLAHATRAIKLISGLSSAKSLLLEENTMKVLNFAFRCNLPILHGLTNLELGVGSSDQNPVLNIPNSTPNLEILVLTMMERMDISSIREPNWRVALPTCSLLHLKKIVKTGSSESKGVEWLKHIIRNAKLHLKDLRMNLVLDDV